ncbi:MAG TPA: SDR family oxidoreductase [Jatrophihabitantaceae bacterium]|jgi:uncharacterized protein YbjT (DUF2867 family)|nr:SDR family oxidoreductase [Jatrophihabitantaceae bacterium]
MRIAIAGGTGWTGRLIIEELRVRGDEPVVLARSVGVDLVTGKGLAGRLDGVDAVVDVTNIVTTRAKRAIRFFEAVTTNLLNEENEADVGHHVALSIIGVDRVDYGYYRGKRAQEELVLAGGRGTVLRATQFHEFAAQMLDRPGPFVIAPKMLSQPVALTEVAAYLVELAHGQPQGMAPELAGPDEQLRMQDMVRQLSHARHGRRPVVPIGLPGKVGKQFTGGALLPTAPGPRGTITFARWLAEQSGPRA